MPHEFRRKCSNKKRVSGTLKSMKVRSRFIQKSMPKEVSAYINCKPIYGSKAPKMIPKRMPKPQRATHLATIFNYNSENCRSHWKSTKSPDGKCAKGDPFGDHFWTEFRKMTSKQGSKKRPLKSNRNVWLKALKMIAKRMPKSLLFHTFT